MTPAGGKPWRLKYRYGSKEKRLSFGPWPDITVEAARAKATEARALLRDGFDPARDQRQGAGKSMAELATAWADTQSWAPSTEKRERYLLAQWLPALGDIPAQALASADIRPVGHRGRGTRRECPPRAGADWPRAPLCRGARAR